MNIRSQVELVSTEQTTDRNYVSRSIVSSPGECSLQAKIVIAQLIARCEVCYE